MIDRSPGNFSHRPPKAPRRASCSQGEARQRRKPSRRRVGALRKASTRVSTRQTGASFTSLRQSFHAFFVGLRPKPMETDEGVRATTEHVPESAGADRVIDKTEDEVKMIRASHPNFRQPAEISVGSSITGWRRPRNRSSSPRRIHPCRGICQWQKHEAQDLRNHLVAPRERKSNRCGRHPVGRSAVDSWRWRTSPPMRRALPGAGRHRPALAPGKMARSISHCSSGAPNWRLPWCAIPRITFENAKPTPSTGSKNTKPARGPAIQRYRTAHAWNKSASGRE